MAELKRTVGTGNGECGN